MSGILMVNEHAGWSVTTALFDHILSGIATQLQETDPIIAKRVLDGTAEVGGFPYLDLCDFTPHDREQFCEAARRFATREHHPDTRSDIDPDYLSMYLGHVDRLVAMLGDN